MGDGESVGPALARCSLHRPAPISVLLFCGTPDPGCDGGVPGTVVCRWEQGLQALVLFVHHL